MVDEENTMIAYTVGNETNYDRSLAEQAARGQLMHKCGKDPEDSYPGGWVWKAFEEARAKAAEFAYVPFAVYEITLAGTWDECTYAFEDGTRRLISNAVVVRKVETPPEVAEG
jgi:hypothetical protein